VTNLPTQTICSRISVQNPNLPPPTPLTSQQPPNAAAAAAAAAAATDESNHRRRQRCVIGGLSSRLDVAVLFLLLICPWCCLSRVAACCLLVAAACSAAAVGKSYRLKHSLPPNLRCGLQLPAFPPPHPLSPFVMAQASLEQCLTQRAEDELFGAWCNDNACEQTASTKDKVRAHNPTRQRPNSK